MQSYLRISPELVPEVYRQIDTDGDGKTSEIERGAWFLNHAVKLTITLDDAKVEANMSKPPPLGREDLLLSIESPLVMTYTYVPAIALEGKHAIELTYGDSYLSYDEYFVSLNKEMISDGQPINISKPQYPGTHRLLYYIPPPDQSENLSSGHLAPAPLTFAGSQQPEAQPVSPEASSSSPAPAEQNTSLLGGILVTLKEWRGEFWSALGLIALALVIGALHALTPGHGKAMVAAYLVGSRGKVRDAVLLGGVVTFTHTAGVITLGLILLLVSNFSMPRALQPALELISGLLVMVLGVYLLFKRWREFGRTGARVAQRTPRPSSIKVRSTLPVRPITTAAMSLATQPQVAGHVAGSHTHDAHDHHHAHTHYHDHDHSPDHTHEHAWEHDHGFGTHTHTHVPSAHNARELIGLGISGGLVPCPDALAILLLATSVGQFALGLGLVISFSLGLASVLIAIGIALVKMRGALDRTKIATNPLWVRWLPLVSAAIVTVVGILMLFAALGSRWS